MKNPLLAQCPLPLPTIEASVQHDNCTDVAILSAVNDIWYNTTTAYGVAQIPYTPLSYTGGTPVLAGANDTWSDVIPIGFTFCFHGAQYTELVIGSNGVVSFGPGNAGGFCSPTTPPSGNVIMCPFQDFDTWASGSISYTTTGSAPCRIYDD